MKIKKHYYCLVDNNNKPDFRFIFTNKHDAEKKRQQIKNSTAGETLFVSKNKRDFFIDGIKKSFIDKTKPIDIKKGCWTTLRTTKISLIDTVNPKIYFKEIITTAQEITTPQSITEFKEKIPTLPTAEAKLIKNKFPLTPPIERSTTTQKVINHQKELSSTYFINKSEDKKHSIASRTISAPKLAKLKKTKYLSPVSKKILRLPNFTFLNDLTTSSNYSFLTTKLFAINFTVILLICFSAIFYTNTSSNKKISSALSKEQQRLVTNQTSSSKNIAVLGSMDTKNNILNNSSTKKTPPTDNIDTMVFNTLIQFEKIRSDQLEESIKKMVAGTPMEKMAPYIAKKDKIVAAFLVGISKKESNYGRRVPVLNGEDCFNYWGYRGIRKRMGSGGHTCFDSPEDAIETVGGRIERLVKSGVDTPEEMVLWKCGSDCNATGGWPAARKWIKDVNMYYTKMLNTASNDEQSSEKIRVLNETTSS
jgi:hypothetical protein